MVYLCHRLGRRISACWRAVLFQGPRFGWRGHQNLSHPPVRFDSTTHQLRHRYPNLSIPVTSPWLGPPLHRSSAVCSGNLPLFFPPGIHLGRLWGEPACSRDNHHLGEGKTPNGPIRSTSGVFALSRYSPSCPGLREHFLPTGKTVTSTPWQ